MVKEGSQVLHEVVVNQPGPENLQYRARHCSIIHTHDSQLHEALKCLNEGITKLAQKELFLKMKMFGGHQSFL